MVGSPMFFWIQILSWRISYCRNLVKVQVCSHWKTISQKLPENWSWRFWRTDFVDFSFLTTRYQRMPIFITTSPSGSEFGAGNIRSGSRLTRWLSIDAVGWDYYLAPSSPRLTRCRLDLNMDTTCCLLDVLYSILYYIYYRIVCTVYIVPSRSGVTRKNSVKQIWIKTIRIPGATANSDLNRDFYWLTKSIFLTHSLAAHKNTK